MKKILQYPLPNHGAGNVKIFTDQEKCLTKTRRTKIGIISIHKF